MIIAIDGPSASGKGTLGKLLAEHYGFAHLDTGLLYRAVAFRLREAGIEPENSKAVTKIAEEIDPAHVNEASLRAHACGELASVIAAIPEVRHALLRVQRDFSKHLPGVVLDGRDIGTVICPEAHVKFFVTARPEIRAQRRHHERAKTEKNFSFHDILEETLRRDQRDAQRSVSPLKAAPDSFLLDTSDLDIMEVFQRAREIVDRSRVLHKS